MEIAQSVSITKLLQHGLTDFEIKELGPRCRLVFSDDKHVDVYADGSQLWYQNGRPHRLDGPAIEWANGHKEWYQNGERHCEDGPAIEYTDGEIEWWQNGKQIFAEVS